jgi:adenosylmethionine-8-amino-7-oxononanoate aminotransferase
MSDYSQGSTSEKVSNELRSALLARGKSILSQNGIEYLDGNSGVTINCKGF